MVSRARRSDLNLLLHRHPLGRLQVVETASARRDAIEAMGLTAVAPEDADGDCDLVFHTSASEPGLATALRLLGTEGEVIELSWYGERSPRVDLGGRYHSERLSIRASQVGRASPARAARRSFADRLAVALDALSDSAFDALLSGPAPFEDLPDLMADLAEGRREAMCPVITYPDPQE